MECAEKWSSDLDFIGEFNKKAEALRIPVSGSIDLTAPLQPQVRSLLSRTEIASSGAAVP